MAKGRNLSKSKSSNEKCFTQTLIFSHLPEHECLVSCASCPRFVVMTGMTTHGSCQVFVTSKRFFVGWWQCSSYGWMFLRPSTACRAALHPDLSLWDIRSHHCPVSPKLGASWNQTQVHWFLGGLPTLVDSSKPFRKPPSSCLLLWCFYTLIFPLILPWPITVLDIFLHACLYAYCFWRESSDAQSQALL